MGNDDPQPGATLSAWDLIGYDGPHYVRIVGGRAKYEAVMFNDSGRQRQVLLARLESGHDGLRQINRYVDPDTLIEIVANRYVDPDTLIEIVAAP